MTAGIRREAAKANPFNAANAVGRVAFTIAAEAGDSINVGVQLQSANAVDLAEVAHLRFYISDDVDGSSLAGTAPDTVGVGATGVILNEPVTNKIFDCISDDSGHLDITIGENGADTWYLVAMLPDGSIQVSDAITFV